MVWYFLFLCGNSRPASKSRLCCDTLQDFAIQEKELPLNILCGSRLCCSWVLTSCICRTGKRIATEQQYKFYFWAGLFYQWTTFPNWLSDTATQLRCGGYLGRGPGYWCLHGGSMIQERSLWDVSSVTILALKLNISNGTHSHTLEKSWFTVERSLSFANSATTPVQTQVNSRDTCKPIQERSLFCKQCN